MTPREQVLARSNSMCEAMVLVRPFTWTRCGQTPVEIHHVLTRGRGGRILDEVGETYHLMALCHYHHRAADGEDAYAGDLLIDGYVTRENGRVVYHGSDPVLKEKYPEDEIIRDHPRSAERSAHHHEA